MTKQHCKHSEQSSRIWLAGYWQATNVRWHTQRATTRRAWVRRHAECGLPVDARGQHNATPLHWAAFHGNCEMVKAILPFGPPHWK